MRVGVEGSRRLSLGAGENPASLTPSFELGLRRDGGDAETGFGADMGAGIAFADAKHGLRLDLRARALVAHEAPGFREWGASAGFSWDPRPDSERGLALSVTQSWGASPSGGAQALLDRTTMAGLAATDYSGRFHASSRLAGELGYGLPAFAGLTGTPNVGFGLTEHGRDWRVGWRLSPSAGDSAFAVSLDATGRQPTTGPAEHGLILKGRLNW